MAPVRRAGQPFGGIGNDSAAQRQFFQYMERQPESEFAEHAAIATVERMAEVWRTGRQQPAVQRAWRHEHAELQRAEYASLQCTAKQRATRRQLERSSQLQWRRRRPAIGWRWRGRVSLERWRRQSRTALGICRQVSISSGFFP